MQWVGEKKKVEEEVTRQRIQGTLNEGRRLEWYTEWKE